MKSIYSMNKRWLDHAQNRPAPTDRRINTAKHKRSVTNAFELISRERHAHMKESCQASGAVHTRFHRWPSMSSKPWSYMKP